MKKINEIKLSLFESDRNGGFGLAHHNAINDNEGNGFDPFWDGWGIFHDVFEHWFEDEHKYFKGDNAFNVGGEMAAMGAMYYFAQCLQIRNRSVGGSWGWNGLEGSLRGITQNMIAESIKGGYCQYGYSLECGVPYQRPVSYGYQYLDDEIIGVMWDEIKAMRFEDEDDSDEAEDSKNYKDSVTFAKIANLHRWGFNMAKRMVDDNNENRIALEEFITFWNEFCQENNAEEMSEKYKGITFKVYKNEGEISWTATFESRYWNDYSDYKISSKNLNVPSMGDMMAEKSLHEY